ncbi:hypothetical protein [Rhizobium sp. RM]|uniref:hypothetical protein n=1 Tax=Rhizobium sp. RM TaxID=2748079 RepID=UPI00110E783B|nr:hypothetical protein [Rhizobium sp. RM]NWJ23017.1 hypothetical protein [Rhizobium sp. RM]TMV12097.1 hypothetical protein BJG94_24195 [Rhizobium sp. Td3]
MKRMKFALILGLLVATGCQTVSPNSPEALKRAEYDRLLLNSTVANCKLIVELNQKRKAQNKEPTRDNQCPYILKNNNLNAGPHAANFIPDVGINGIPIPLGSLVRLAVVADRNQREKKALEATLPAWVSAQGETATHVYRILLTQGFKPDEVDGLKGSGKFADAVRSAAPFVQFVKDNPDTVKRAQA